MSSVGKENIGQVQEMMRFDILALLVQAIEGMIRMVEWDGEKREMGTLYLNE